MKRTITSLFILALVTAYPLAGFGQLNLEKDPAYLPIDKVIDLKTIRPEVNVNLPRFLLKDALSGLTGTSTNSASLGGIDLADLVKDVKLIRVVVIEANKTNRPALNKAVKTLRKELDKKWTAIVSVPENNVGVYAMSDPAGESNTGLAVLVYDGDDAVIGNIVGHVSIGKLIKIASQSNKLPKNFLKELQGLGPQTKKQPTTKSSGGSSTHAVSAGSKSPKGGSPAK